MGFLREFFCESELILVLKNKTVQRKNQLITISSIFLILLAFFRINAQIQPSLAPVNFDFEADKLGQPVSG